MTLHCQRIFATNIGFDSDIHLWKIRYSNSKSREIFGRIGVVSNVNTVLKNRRRKYEIHSAFMGNSYFFDKHCQAILGYANGVKTDHIDPLDDDYVSWNDNDEVVVLLDCNKWRLSFYLNEKHFIGEIKIKPQVKYYPVIQFYAPEDQYEVVEYV